MTVNNEMNQVMSNEATNVNNGMQHESNSQFNNFDQNGQNTNVESKQSKRNNESFFKSTGVLITAVTIALLVGFAIGTPQSIAHKDFKVETRNTSDFGHSWNDNRCPMH